MNSRCALTLVQQAVRWPLTGFTSRCCSPRCQAWSKVSQVDYSVLASRNVLSNFSPLLLQSFTNSQRSYASKKKDKKKATTAIDMTGLGQLIEVEDMVKKMEAAIEAMKTEFVKGLSLRSSGSVEAIKVTFEGKEYELQQIAKITRKGQQTVVIDMLSFPQMTKAVVDSLRTSALNLNPQQEGTTIFVPIPKVTKEHREILAKKAKALFFKCRDLIKKEQEVHIEDLKNNDLGETERQSAYKQVRAIADKYVSQSEEIMKAKQDELLGK